MDHKQYHIQNRMYLITVNITIDSSGFAGSGLTYLSLQYSTNNTTYADKVIVPQNYQFPGNQNIYCTGMIGMAANSYVRVNFYNNSGGNVGFNTGGNYSTLQIARVC